MDDTAKLPPAVEPPTATSGPPPRSVPIELSLSQEAPELARTEARPDNPDYLTPGTTVNGWLIERKVGAGGMGAVYLVRHQSTGKVAALKVSLPPTDESADARRQRIARFEREFAAVLLLDHPHILRPMSFFSWPDPQDGHPCIVMPYVDGQMLRGWCRAATPSLRVVLQGLLAPVADALHYIHEKHLCHRDIKPANIMVTREGKPLVMDFGIARSRAARTLTSTEILTTYEFGAPEYLAYIGSQERFLEHAFEYRPEADLFCLGGTFYDVLTGHLPYQHVAGFGDALAYLSPTFRTALQDFAPLPPSKRNPAVPAEVDALFVQMMARAPDERFASGGEVVAAVEALLGGLPAPHPLLDAPFSPPPRVRPPPPGEADTHEEGARPPSAKARGRQAASGPTVAPPPPPPEAPPEPSFVQGAAAPPRSAPPFHPPTVAARGAFAAPVAAPAPPAVAAVEGDALPTGLRVVRERLAAAAPAAPRRWLLAGLVGGAVVLTLVVAAASRAPAPAPPRAQSLLDEQEAEAPARASPQPLPALSVAAEPLGLAPDAGADLPAPASPAPARAGNRRSAGADGRAIEALLAREYGGQRPVLSADGGPAVRPRAARAAWVQGDMMEPDEAPAPATQALGIPTGAEIAARLTKPLDSRTTGSGPAVAKLMRPFVLRGAIALPAGTMVYGQAAGTAAGRFDVRFTRLRLPDGREVAVEALAYDAADNKPGLRATQRVTGGAAQGPGLGETLAKGAASTALTKVAGGDALDVARGAGQTLLEHPRATPAAPGEALLLDAPTDFVVFVGVAF